MDAFWIDYEYDVGHADDGVSRYGAYVRRNMDRFAESWDGTYDQGAVPFARTAWEIGTGPVMSPPYVCLHPRIRSATIIRNEWDLSLGAAVQLVAPQPKPLRHLAVEGGPLATPGQPAGPFGPTGTRWRDWPSEHSFTLDTTLWYEPSGQQVCRDPYLITTVELDFSMPRAQAALPVPAESWASGGVAEESARQVIEILVRELNRIVGPVLARIEEG